MADTRRTGDTSSSYGSNQSDNRGTYGRGSSYEAESGYESYGRGMARPVQIRDRSFRSRYDYDRGESWNIMGTETVSALAIGAGLGFLAGYLFTGSEESSGRNWQSGGNSQNRSGRSWFGGSQSSSSVETDETTDLIASNKVEGTAVYDRQGSKLGEVYNFMVGKRSGRVAYAVLSFGGLLGVGSSYYPLPWNTLTYDTSKGGYVVDIDKERLENAPSHSTTEDGFSDPNYGRRVSEYWGSQGSTASVY